MEFNDFPPQNAPRCEPVNVAVGQRFGGDLTQFLHSSREVRRALLGVSRCHARQRTTATIRRQDAALDQDQSDQNRGPHVVAPASHDGNRDDAAGKKEPDRRVQKLDLYQPVSSTPVVRDVDEIEFAVRELPVWKQPPRLSERHEPHGAEIAIVAHRGGEPARRERAI